MSHNIALCHVCQKHKNATPKYKRTNHALRKNRHLTVSWNKHRASSVPFLPESVFLCTTTPLLSLFFRQHTTATTMTAMITRIIPMMANGDMPLLLPPDERLLFNHTKHNTLHVLLITTQSEKQRRLEVPLPVHPAVVKSA